MSATNDNSSPSGADKIQKSAAANVSEQAPALPKRFYKDVTVEPSSDLYAVALDGRPLRTPAKQPLLVPTQALAAAIAEEWRAQGEFIDPASMPHTKLANTTVDGVRVNHDDVCADVARFSAMDLLCYRTDQPKELVEKQQDEWDPILKWAEHLLDVRFKCTSGVMPITQDDALSACVCAYLADISAFELAPLHTFTTLTGSAVLALAVYRKKLSAEQAWSKAHVDEDWQISQWGADEEAAARRQLRWLEMQNAATFLSLAQA